MVDDDGPSSRERTREAWVNFVEVVATIVRVVGAVIALVLVAHVVLVVGSANPDNGITTFVRTWAHFFALGFRDLFTPADAKLRTIVNYGIAAAFWLVAAGIVVRLLRRFA